MRTQVVIIGAGPSGLLLAQLLDNAGIDSVVLEDRSREYVEARIRAGVLEQDSVDVLREAGVADRLDKEGLVHGGIYLQFLGERHHIDFQKLCNGASVVVYGQTEVQKDLAHARQERGQQWFYEVENVVLHAIESNQPFVTFVDAEGKEQRIDADFVAGCDGFHGVSRNSIPANTLKTYERVYPYSWLGILADVEPSTDELIYAWHPDGFAMHSMRSSHVSRLYIEVTPEDDLSNWSDERVWDALAERMALTGWELKTGPVTDKGITPMRSFVSEPMRHGSLFIAGDAGHIVPPTGAKGLNQAFVDVRLLAEAFIARLNEKTDSLINAYSANALAQVWRRTHFSWWMTSMLHTSNTDEFDRMLQLSQLRYVTSSEAAMTTLAENYVGLAPAAPIGLR